MSSSGLMNTCEAVMPDHGTLYRYLQHHADGDDPCVPCQIAWRQAQCADKPVSPAFGAGGVLIDEILPEGVA